MSCGGGHLGFPIGIKNRNFLEDLPMIIPGQFGFNCPVKVNITNKLLIQQLLTEVKSITQQQAIDRCQEYHSTAG